MLGTTVRVDVSTAGAQANGAIRVAALSGDGRWAASSSPATNLVPGDSNTVRGLRPRAAALTDEYAMIGLES
ncbi:MAG TPA: hypothetical protein VGI72_10065 [Gaiellales bacterium]